MLGYIKFVSFMVPEPLARLIQSWDQIIAMDRIVERGKNPGAAREEGRKERREDATLIPFLIERQLESSRAQL